MRNAKRTTALLLAAAVLFGMLFSAVFIASEAGHDCSGAECTICEAITVCTVLLKTAVFTATVLFAVAACGTGLSRKSTAYTAAYAVHTPVTLKTKLSD